ncbi:MAG: biotin--[acetyl-CoA-carboxylase] ligase [Acidimicrobiales bacterium]
MIGHVVETGSTNADLLSRAAEGLVEGSALVADHQTAGRGRQARRFFDEPGNAMLLSALLRPPSTVAPVLPFVAGHAVVDAVDALVGRGLVALKWPNDVLVPSLGERKLAGILTEATTRVGEGDPSPLAVVIGIGLNLRWSGSPPDEVAARSATVAELGADLERWDMVRAVLTALDRWYDRALVSPVGVVDAYRERCLTLGRRVRLETPGGVVEGTATSVADDGALVVDTADGPRTVTAGDAHHL